MPGAKAEGRKIRKKEKELRKKVQAPTYLEPEVGAEQNRVNPYAYYKSTDLVQPVSGFEELEIRKTFEPPAKKEGNFRLTEIPPEKISAIGRQVKYQEKAILGHQIASWAVENEKPGEQKKLADIDPDLYAKMNEGPKDIAAFCMYLDQLLRKGEITNEEERLFVTSLLDPLVEIPVYPLWDPDGNVIGAAQWKLIHAKAQLRKTPQLFGMFTQQLIWGATETQGELNKKGNTLVQRALKAMILIHLLPELRHTVDGQAIKVTINDANVTIDKDPKNASAKAFLATYLTNGIVPTDIAETATAFEKYSQSPFAYGLSMYNTPIGTKSMWTKVMINF